MNKLLTKTFLLLGMTALSSILYFIYGNAVTCFEKARQDNYIDKLRASNIDIYLSKKK